MPLEFQERKESGVEKIFEKMIAKNLPNVIKDIKVQGQEAQ